MNFLGYFIEIQILILIVIFAISFCIQLLYYLKFYGKIITYRPKPSFHQPQPVSVIITAKNEEHNLIKFLPSVLEQDYPDYEVIVVDDCSSDNTSNVLSEFKTRYPHLKVTFITEDDKFKHGKKLAVTIGIKAAKNEWLLFTDADCKPVGKNWISTMQRNFTEDTDLVLGYSGFIRLKSLLNVWIRLDTVFTALQYLTFALNRRPYMGVGRNLAYRKSVFFKNKGFANHYHILSGDDDLFVNEVAKPTNTRVEFSHESHVLSVPSTRFSDWLNRKRRHLKTGFYYKKSSKFLLGAELVSRELFYFTFAALLILQSDWLIFLLSAFSIRLIIQHIIFKFAMKRLKEQKLLAWLLVYDLLMPFINFIIVFVNYLTPTKNKWK